MPEDRWAFCAALLAHSGKALEALAAEVPPLERVRVQLLTALVFTATELHAKTAESAPGEGNPYAEPIAEAFACVLKQGTRKPTEAREAAATEPELRKLLQQVESAPEGAWRAVADYLERCRAKGDCALAVEALMRIAVALYRRGGRTGTVIALERAIAVAQGTAPGWECCQGDAEAALIVGLGFIALWQEAGRSGSEDVPTWAAEAQRWVRAAMARAAAVGDYAKRVELLLHVAFALAIRRHRQEVWECLESEAFTEAWGQISPVAQAYGLAQMARVVAALGDSDETVAELLRRGFEVAVFLRNPLERVHALRGLAAAMADLEAIRIAPVIAAVEPITAIPIPLHKYNT